MTQITEEDKAASAYEMTLYEVVLEYNLQSGVRQCVCQTYLLTHRNRLIRKMVETALEQNRKGDDVVSKFVNGLHQRHLDGKSLG